MTAPPNNQAPFRDPRPSVERITQLAQRVLDGDILLPRFQRDFVWNRVQVRDLLDSIAQNYPIGSVLLWQSRQELASERAIAGLPIADRRPDYPVNYLLDGQQRLSTICGALHWRPNEDPNSIWNLVYDLTRQEFMHLNTLDEPPLSQIPLRLLSHPANFFRRTAALEDETHRARADAIFNRLQDYMIAAVTLGDMSINAVAPVFERINSTGTRLTIVDLMRAATWSPAFDLRDSIDEILAVLSDKNFGSIDRRTVLRSIAAVADLGFATENIDQLRTKSPEELRGRVTEAEAGARRAVDFLVTHLRVPRSEALPYMNQMAMLVALFDKVPSPTSAQLEAIETWFWRTTLSGYFGGWNSGQMATDHRSISEFAAGGTDALEVASALPRADVWRVRQFRANSAISKMLALMLSFRQPVDLMTGQAIDTDKALAWSNDKEFHHFFPRAHLHRAGVSSGKANAVGNIVMLSSASNITIRDDSPRSYLGRIAQEVGENVLIQRLERSLVPEAAYRAALADDYNTFLRLRAEHLHTHALGLAREADDATATVAMPAQEATAMEEARIEDPQATE